MGLNGVLKIDSFIFQNFEQKTATLTLQITKKKEKESKRKKHIVL
jgi:hypothetical protein